VFIRLILEKILRHDLSQELDDANMKRNEGIQSEPKPVLAIDVQGTEKVLTLHEKTNGMGIVNCTPDSIQNGLLPDSRNPDFTRVLGHIKAFLSRGVDIIDVGGSW
jgi:hypothetical protein